MCTFEKAIPHAQKTVLWIGVLERGGCKSREAKQVTHTDEDIHVTSLLCTPPCKYALQTVGGGRTLLSFKQLMCRQLNMETSQSFPELAHFFKGYTFCLSAYSHLWMCIWGEMSCSQDTQNARYTECQDTPKSFIGQNNRYNHDSPPHIQKRCQHF